MRPCLRWVMPFLLFLAVPMDHLAAQARSWGLGVDVGLTRFWGGSEPVAPNEAPGFKPYRPTTFGARLDRLFGWGKVAVGVLYAQSGLGSENDELAIIAKGGVDLIEATPEAAYRLGTLGPVTEVSLFAGPVLDVWMLSGEDTRLRIGGRAGLELLVPLGGALAGTVRAHGGLSGSLFRGTEVPNDFRTKSMPNAGIALGLRLGL
jgi:hypothetical protein